LAEAREAEAREAEAREAEAREAEARAMGLWAATASREVGESTLRLS
jgi:hypothetical protein